MKIIKAVFDKIAFIGFRNIIYILIGIYLLATGVLQKDWIFGIFSLLFFYQGIFNTCLFGACSLPKRTRRFSDKQSTISYVNSESNQIKK